MSDISCLSYDEVLDEKWEPVPGFSDYEASSLGRVRSVDRVVSIADGWHGAKHRSLRGSLLRQMPYGNPATGLYLRVTLYRNKRGVPLQVHRVILFAFRGNPPTADHIGAHNDGNRFNNRLSNLRWATRSENEADKVVHGTRGFGEKHAAAKFTDELAINLILDMRHGMSGVAASRKWGVSVPQAHNLYHGKQRSYLQAEADRIEVYKSSKDAA